MTDVNDLLRAVLEVAEDYRHQFFREVKERQGVVGDDPHPVLKEAHAYLDGLEQGPEELAAFKDFDATVHVVPMKELDDLRASVERIEKVLRGLLHRLTETSHNEGDRIHHTLSCHVDNCYVAALRKELDAAHPSKEETDG